MATTDWMHWFLTSELLFDLYTNHNNLIFIFYPKSVITDIYLKLLSAESSVWAVCHTTFSKCVQVPDSDNFGQTFSADGPLPQFYVVC